MDLHSGSPYWSIKNPMLQQVSALDKDLTTETLIIGAGITGALVAHELCSTGMNCVVVDKRSIAGGSTSASTAQLQYEIDVPLHQLVKKMDEKKAVAAYKASLKSINDLKKVLKQTRVDGEFQQIPTLLLASNRKGLRELKEEYTIRKKNKLPVEFLDAATLKGQYNIDRHGALWNNTSAQIDCYKTTIGLFNHHQKENQLKLFPYTEIVAYSKSDKGFTVQTSKGFKITCKYMVIAAGFEAGKFLPEKVMNLISTYALASEPLTVKSLWPERCLIWETKQPYYYMRTTSDNRIMMGGEDIPFKNAKLRDAQLPKKIKILEKKFKGLFPDIPMVTDFSWCGTFSSTSDGLPYIGEYKDRKNVFFALGYGGNGITFSMIAAQLIRNKIFGNRDNREQVFGFER
ncbi:FAD-dependent oxidoreductase [Olivibacter sp. SDN3]|uniref:NAD(P)/FAD-dependent oxidoreductase n=1 Tax=Olivibacter sp. SDN3 TaxID=2764720 RepID=UPI001650FB40|nr:FAD-dependent oxidoreductase [Olivibacter sp. SDN3]QNL50016.1 FAD-dependent oxidoreductase [Olivibacter sp. SDN3]